MLDKTIFYSEDAALRDGDEVSFEENLGTEQCGEDSEDGNGFLPIYRFARVTCAKVNGDQNVVEISIPSDSYSRINGRPIVKNVARSDLRKRKFITVPLIAISDGARLLSLRLHHVLCVVQ
jgi:hypothetical protein